jgi:hypothetical protein
MEIQYRKPSILTLTNIKLDENQYENQYDKIYFETKELEMEVANDYDLIPNKYIHDQWPVFTNIHCPNCSLQFKGRPIPIPCSTFELKDDGNITFSVSEIACSFPCASSMISNKQVLSTLYFIIKKSYAFDIPNAPKKTLMKHYGGKLTIDEYKKLINSMELSIKSHNSKIKFSNSSVIQLFDTTNSSAIQVFSTTNNTINEHPNEDNFWEELLF